MDAASWNIPALIAKLNEAMNAKFSPGEKTEYLLSHQELPYIQLNQPAFDRAGINEQEAEDAIVVALPAAIDSLPAQPAFQPPVGTPPAVVDSSAAAKTNKTATPTRAQSARNARRGRHEPEAEPQPVAAEPAAPQPLEPASNKLAPRPALAGVYTRVQLTSGPLPPDEFGRLLAHSTSTNGGWYVMLIPTAYQMNGNPAGTGTTHFSAWSYDRHVPLAFYGTPFNPGTYRGRVGPVDFAATFASLLGVNQPSASVGRVLTEALRPATAAASSTPEPAPRTSRARRAATHRALQELEPETTQPGSTPPQ